MPKIAIIDDGEDQREILKDLVELALPEGDAWSVIASVPLADINSYTQWLQGNEVAVITIDERLREKASTIDYDGHDIVRFIREHLPEFPIFVITSHTEDEDIQDRFKDVEDIIQRKKFIEKSREYTQRFLRAAKKYLEVYQLELAELSRLSQKIAQNEASKGEIRKAAAIQEKLQIAFDPESLSDRRGLLNKFEQEIKKYEMLNKEFRQFLKNQK